jgi:hypothetical protein
MRKMVQFGCSPCIIFASLLHVRFDLYLCVEQVNERKLECVWCMEKAALKPASARHQQAFLGLVLTAAQGGWHVLNQAHSPSATGQAPALGRFLGGVRRCDFF